MVRVFVLQSLSVAATTTIKYVVWPAILMLFLSCTKNYSGPYVFQLHFLWDIINRHCLNCIWTQLQ